MTKETHQWLSENTLIGFTEKRGNAWHYREGDDNHFTGPVPVTAVEERLFHWTADESPLYVPSGDGFEMVPGRKAIVRSDNGHVLGVHGMNYHPHQYNEWLLKAVSDIIDSDLQIGSAGLLKGGAVAWLSVEMPENIVTPEGVTFRPFILAATSLDGSISSTYGRAITNTVCDNTMSVAMREHGGQRMRVRSTRKSQLRLNDVREALGIVYSTADAFSAQVAELSALKVTDRDFERIVDEFAPLPRVDTTLEKPRSTRGLTMAERKRDMLWNMWETDERVTPWSGTAYGAWQALNTYGQHEGIVRGTSRQERNMLNTVNGSIESADTDTVRRIMTLVA